MGQFWHDCYCMNLDNVLKSWINFSMVTLYLDDHTPCPNLPKCDKTVIPMFKLDRVVWIMPYFQVSKVNYGILPNLDFCPKHMSSLSSETDRQDILVIACLAIFWDKKQKNAKIGFQLPCLTLMNAFRVNE